MAFAAGPPDRRRIPIPWHILTDSGPAWPWTRPRGVKRPAFAVRRVAESFVQPWHGSESRWWWSAMRSP
jgi:hypothetical protein